MTAKDNCWSWLTYSRGDNLADPSIRIVSAEPFPDRDDGSQMKANTGDYVLKSHGTSSRSLPSRMGVNVATY